MKTILLFSSILIIALSSCKQTGNEAQAQIPVTSRDTSIKLGASYSETFFDSLQMEKFIGKQQFHDSIKKRMRNFYNARNYQYAWFFKEGMADYASSFYVAYKEYISYSQDTALRNYSFEQLYDSLWSGNFKYDINDSIVLKMELLLTGQFFRYSRRAYQGSNQLDARELDWFIPRKKIDPSALLDSLLAHKGKNISAFEPLNRQYNLLKEYLLRYYEGEKKGSWPFIKAEKKSYKSGDSSTALIAIKKRLIFAGDLLTEDTTAIFTKELEDAVKSFERRYGMKEDGIVTTALIA